MTLAELKQAVENFKVTYNYEDDYNTLYNLCNDYDDLIDYVFYGDERIITYDDAEEMAKNELEDGGLIRLYYFMGDCDFNDDLFYLNAYGNLESVSSDTFEVLCTEILDWISEQEDDEV